MVDKSKLQAQQLPGAPEILSDEDVKKNQGVGGKFSALLKHFWSPSDKDSKKVGGLMNNADKSPPPQPNKDSESNLKRHISGVINVPDHESEVAKKTLTATTTSQTTISPLNTARTGPPQRQHNTPPALPERPQPTESGTNAPSEAPLKRNLNSPEEPKTGSPPPRIPPRQSNQPNPKPATQQNETPSADKNLPKESASTVNVQKSPVEKESQYSAPVPTQNPSVGYPTDSKGNKVPPRPNTPPKLELPASPNVTTPTNLTPSSLKLRLQTSTISASASTSKNLPQLPPVKTTAAGSEATSSISATNTQQTQPKQTNQTPGPSQKANVHLATNSPTSTPNASKTPGTPKPKSTSPNVTSKSSSTPSQQSNQPASSARNLATSQQKPTTSSATNSPTPTTETQKKEPGKLKKNQWSHDLIKPKTSP